MGGLLEVDGAVDGDLPVLVDNHPVLGGTRNENPKDFPFLSDRDISQSVPDFSHGLESPFLETLAGHGVAGSLLCLYELALDALPAVDSLLKSLSGVLRLYPEDMEVSGSFLGLLGLGELLRSEGKQVRVFLGPDRKFGCGGVYGMRFSVRRSSK